MVLVERVECVAVLGVILMLVAFMLLITFGVFVRAERRGFGIGDASASFSSSVDGSFRWRVRASLLIFAGGADKTISFCPFEGNTGVRVFSVFSR